MCDLRRVHRPRDYRPHLVVVDGSQYSRPPALYFGQRPLLKGVHLNTHQAPLVFAAVVASAGVMACAGAFAPRGRLPGGPAVVLRPRDLGPWATARRWTGRHHKAIDAANAAGGGTVFSVPARTASFSIHPQSNVTLYLDQGAILLAAGASGGGATAAAAERPVVRLRRVVRPPAAPAPRRAPRPREAARLRRRPDSCGGTDPIGAKIPPAGSRGRGSGLRRA